MTLDQFIAQKTIYRTLGRDSLLGHLGCGFMQKAKTREDIVDYRKNEYSMIYVLRGNGEYIDKSKRRYNLSPGTIFHRFPNNHHTTILDPGSNWAECFIALGSNMYAVLETLGIIDNRRPVIPLGLSIDLVKRFDDVFAMLQRAPDRKLGPCFTALISLINDALHSSTALATRSGTDRLIERACLRLEQDADIRLPLKTVARDLSIGYEHFRKVFKSATGLSPNEYRIRRRMERARMLLQQKNSIKSVAAELGYPNAYAFATQFKRAVGIAPGQYMKG